MRLNSWPPQGQTHGMRVGASGLMKTAWVNHARSAENVHTSTGSPGQQGRSNRPSGCRSAAAAGGSALQNARVACKRGGEGAMNDTSATSSGAGKRKVLTTTAPALRIGVRAGEPHHKRQVCLAQLVRNRHAVSHKLRSRVGGRWCTVPSASVR